MSDKNIFQASKSGDINRIKFLVEKQNIDVNSKDPNYVRKYFHLFYYFF